MQQLPPVDDTCQQCREEAAEKLALQLRLYRKPTQAAPPDPGLPRTLCGTCFASSACIAGNATPCGSATQHGAEVVH